MQTKDFSHPPLSGDLSSSLPIGVGTDRVYIAGRVTNEDLEKMAKTPPDASVSLFIGPAKVHPASCSKGYNLMIDSAGSLNDGKALAVKISAVYVPVGGKDPPKDATGISEAQVKAIKGAGCVTIKRGQFTAPTS